MSSKPEFDYSACPGLMLDEKGRPIPKDRPRYEKDDMLAAAFRGDNDTVLAAIARGEDVNFKDKHTGLSALHLAVSTNNLELTKSLVEEHNAEFFADGFGRWPSSIACDLDHVTDEMADYICHAEARFLGIDTSRGLG